MIHPLSRGAALYRGQGQGGGRSLFPRHRLFPLRRQAHYNEVVGDGTLKNHDPEGDFLYGIDIFVSPDYREKRRGRRLYDARKELCETLNLKGIIIGGRIPGYAEWADKKTPQQYLRMVNNREISDPVLTFQVSNDFHYKKMVENYWRRITAPRDTASSWSGTTSITRSGRGSSQGEDLHAPRGRQWQMRSFESFEDFLQAGGVFRDTQAG